MAIDSAMNWKSFTIKLIEALRWPVAVVVIFVLLRVPLGQLISGLALKISG